jgi:hypothetical protein
MSGVDRVPEYGEIKYRDRLDSECPESALLEPFDMSTAKLPETLTVLKIRFVSEAVYGLLFREFFHL